MSDDAAKKLEDQLTCAICLEQYKDPRSLSCLHSFCTECLKRLPRDKEGDEDENISCPTCRNITKIPQGMVTALPITFHINNLLEVQDLLQKSFGSSHKTCGNCPQEEAKFYCQQCDKLICHECNGIHKKWSSLADHKVMGIEEVAHKATNMVSIKPTPPMECPSHNEPLKVYCIKCDQPICYLCTIKDHKGHDHTLVNDAFEECKQKFEKQIQSLKEKIKVREERMKDMEGNKTSIREKAKENQLMINNLCNDLVGRVEQLRRHGLQVVEMGTASYIAYEDEQIEKEQGAIQTLNDCKNHVERSLEKSTPTQLLLIAKQTTDRFDKLFGSLIPDVIKPKSSTASIEQLEVIQHKAVQDLSKNILTEVSLQYPQPMYERCELVTDLPDRIRINCSLCTATFSLLFNGHSMAINTDSISCFFESEAAVVQPLPFAGRRRHNQTYMNESQKKEKVSCDVRYFQDDAVKYQVQFIPPRTAGLYRFTVHIGTCVVNNKIKVDFFQ